MVFEPGRELAHYEILERIGKGGELFYRDGDEMMAVTVEARADGELALGTPRELFERSAPGWDYDVTADGRRFIMVDDSASRKSPTELILVQNWVEELKRLVPSP